MLMSGYTPPGRYPRKDGESDTAGLWASFVALSLLVFLLWAVAMNQKAKEAKRNTVYCEMYAAGELAERRPDHDEVCK